MSLKIQFINSNRNHKKLSKEFPILYFRTMDLSMLLAQAEMSYSKTNFYKGGQSNNKSKKNQEIVSSVFEENLDTIASFLKFKDTQNLRLVCRSISYQFIVRDLWGGIKNEVADMKFQDYDDYEFVEQEPKQISKEDKKIRIHSLKKNLTNNSLAKKPKRQASNIKEKKMAMSIVDTQLNQFQKTQMGFKRLLKTVNPSIVVKGSMKPKQAKNIDIEEAISFERLPDLLQIPTEYSIDDLIINPKDQWVKNIQRANNLITVVRKWLSFQSKFWTLIGKIGQQDDIELIILMKKVIKIDGSLLAYKITMEEEPHCTIGKIIADQAPKNALIQQQLNKLGKQFISNHLEFTELIQKKQTEQLITVLHQSYQKISQKVSKSVLEAPAWAEGLNILDESFDSIMSKLSIQKLKVPLQKAIKNIFKKLIDQHLSRQIIFNQHDKVNFKEISFKFLIENSQFCQFSFQILYSLVGKLSALNISEENPLGSSSSLKQNENVNAFSKKLKPLEKSSKLMSTTLSKFKSNSESNQSSKGQKALFGILWNISKYFDKLQKQLIAKENKKKEEGKVMLIKQFFQNQGRAFKEGITLVCQQSSEQSYLRSLTDVEDYYKEFKVKIEKLKEEMGKMIA